MIVSTCCKEGCNALTIGSYCVEHDVPVTRAFVRGRPFTGRPARREAAAGPLPSRPVRRATAVSA